MKSSIFILFFTGVLTAAGQKRNVYFLRNDGKQITTHDSADYIRIITEPDSGSVLYNVFEFYKDGKKKLVGKSLKVEPLEFNGQCVRFFPNGNRESIVNYDTGIKKGPEYDFYPNGKTYRLIDFNGKDVFAFYPDNYEIKENYDSLGTALIADGNGIYKGFDEKFKYVSETGRVKNGLRDSIWQGKEPFSDELSKVITLYTEFTEHYKNGRLINGTATDPFGKTHNYINSRSTMPQFKGCLTAFYQYLSQNIQYPYDDKKSGTQGKVVIQFVVDKNGKIADIKILRHVSPGIDAEAVRVITASPLWDPGTMFGQPVRVYYTVPISFTLAHR